MRKAYSCGSGDSRHGPMVNNAECEVK